MRASDRSGRGLWLEAVAIVGWAAFVVRSYLDFDPHSLPSSGEWLASLQHYHFWVLLRECGSCALWWGSSEGGNPALGDLVGNVLHPLVAIPTLALGVIAGSKISALGAFVMTGLAQWWLGITLGLGRLVRVFMGLLAVVAGLLGPKVIYGPHMLLSFASCSLALAALVAFAHRPDRRRTAVLALAIGSAALGGIMYAQIGFLSIAPLTLVYLSAKNRSRLLGGLVGGAILGLALAAPYLLPLSRFLPEVIKEHDLKFSGRTSIAAVARSLVESDENAYFRRPGVHPGRFANYVGWAAVALASGGLIAGLVGRHRRDGIFLAAAVAVPLWISTGIPFERLSRSATDPEWRVRFASVRSMAMIGGMAVPPLLGLAGIGTQVLLDRRWAPRRFRPRSGAGECDGAKAASTAPRALEVAATGVLVVPLAFAVVQAYQFNTLQIHAGGPSIRDVGPMNEALRTEDLAWVSPPIGRHAFTVGAVAAGLKVHADVIFRSWEWGWHPPPPATRMAILSGDPPSPDWVLREIVLGARIYDAPPGSEYASLVAADGTRSVCSASGRGGYLDVRCPPSAQGGTVTLLENNYPGWRAIVDGKEQPPRDERWLSIELPAGVSEASFRFRPSDVWLGTAACVGALAVVGWLWVGGRRRLRAAPTASA